ncbi:MAG TPA: PEP-CTERM-box response regulator transcription factor [Candidatus Competibacteraceae bacterium]|nr:PEP-CTERM-box response regulator transcription factor [Candidatus Competibacteraceae bacterium]MCP5133882.1 PEP-CTERM-box response regulator transcription factor [Gammaproteobacteria bacterium]HPF58778.1 PEP-CTERM-box response regulator transcription factor [Candidatus Competibacteraceae bacterium]HRY19437.1 PEP-CTERM-box response regulator transcription factor [Candidatus Competibacteraceae bacterium]
MEESSRKLLVIEDDSGLRSQLRWCFDGYEVFMAEDRETGLAQVRRYTPSIVLLDLGLPPDPANASEGLKALEQIRFLAPETKVIVVTGNDERKNALQAIAMGAYDFYQKPVDADVLRLLVDRAYNLYVLEQENRELLARQAATPLRGVIAGSPEMLKVCRKIQKIAPTNANVLLLGESGTGKEVLTRALHELSPRSQGAFVAINCAAIPDTLLESELFGHEKGSFTGAIKQSRGKIEYADGGTLMLDEVGDLPLPLQAKLLRFLQERVIERVGGREIIPVDVRVVCATHRDLSALISEGHFREDLYYRISEITVQIPPLCEREGDVLLIAHALLGALGQSLGKTRPSFSPDAVRALEKHRWPGNIRELENRLKRALIMSESGQVTAHDLELDAADDEETIVVEPPPDLRQAREQAERHAIQQALDYTGGNLSHAAELLGITRPTLYTLLNKHGLKA